jgi:hypothetical protein
VKATIHTFIKQLKFHTYMTLGHQIIKSTDEDDWHQWTDPDVWVNQNDDSWTIEASIPFSELPTGEFYRDWAESAFDDIEVWMGNIRIKRYNTPYYECDPLYLRGIGWSAYFPRPGGIRDDQAYLTDFNYQLGKILTGPNSGRDFDDVLAEGDIEHRD